MAVISKNSKAKLQMKDYDRKLLCTYHGIEPLANANKLQLFSESVSDLRNDETAYTYLIVESELENDGL